LINGLIRLDPSACCDYAHALDRVLQWNYYWIPNYYPPGSSTVWWNRFGMPAFRPATDEAIETWWEISSKPLTNQQMTASNGASAIPSEVK
jgi:microcin C transport system substrate-binding protein